MTKSDVDGSDVVLRVPMITRLGRSSFTTVDEHNDVVKNEGQTYVGKFGRPGSILRHNKIIKSINDGTLSRLILVYKEGGRFHGFSSRLHEISFGDIDPQKYIFRPKYYNQLETDPSMWFLIKSPLLPCSLSDLHLESNGRPLLTVMSECRMSHLIVRRVA